MSPCSAELSGTFFGICFHVENPTSVFQQAALWVVSIINTCSVKRDKFPGSAGEGLVFKAPPVRGRSEFECDLHGSCPEAITKSEATETFLWGQSLSAAAYLLQMEAGAGGAWWDVFTQPPFGLTAVRLESLTCV